MSQNANKHLVIYLIMGYDSSIFPSMCKCNDEYEFLIAKNVMLEKYNACENEWLKPSLVSHASFNNC